MATAFTHGFVGALLVPLAPKEIPRAPLVALVVLLTIVPDVDVVAFSLGIPYGDPFGHRGMTHSMLFSLLAGFAGATLFVRHVAAFSARWLWLATLLFLASISHGILDAFTDAGLGVAFFFPIDNTRYFFPWRPLATSPIGITSFFNGNALYILKNEFFWVWLPCLVVVSLSRLMIFLSRRAGSGSRQA